MDTQKKLYKILVATVVADLSYEAGQTYELSDEQAAAFKAEEIEVVAVPPVPPAEVPGAQVEVPPAPAVTPATPWAGNHKI